jgi:hypothetical protein
VSKESSEPRAGMRVKVRLYDAMMLSKLEAMT